MKFKSYKRSLCMLLALLLAASLLPNASAEESGVLQPDFPALVDTANEERVPGVIELTDAKYYALQILPFRGRYAQYHDALTGYCGVIDCTGAVLWQPKDPNIDVIQVFENGIAAALFIDKENEAENGWRFFTVNGKQLSPQNILINGFISKNDWATGEQCYVFADAYSADSREPIGRMVMDAKGHFILEEGLHNVFNGALPCKKNGKWGLCEITGKNLLPYSYDELEFVDANSLLAKQNGVYRLIDRSGKTIKELTGVSEANILFNTNRVAICENGLWGICDAMGKQTVECKYSMLEGAYYGQDTWELTRYFRGKLGNEWHVFSDDGVTDLNLREDRYSDVRKLENGVWSVYSSNSLRIVDDKDQVLYPGSWNTHQYDNGYLVLANLDLRTYRSSIVLYNSAREKLLQLENVGQYGFTKNALCCEQDGAIEFYSLANQELLNRHRNASLADRDEYCAVLLCDNRYAMTDANGTLLTEFVYDNGRCVGNGVCGLRRDAVYTLFDARGRVLEESLASIESFLEDSPYTSYSRGNKFGFLQYRAAEDPMFADLKKTNWFAEGADFCALTGLMNGVGGGKFAPQTVMTRAMLVRVLYNLSGTAAPSHGFSDVPDGKWYTEAVNWAAANDLVNGVNSKTFAPNEPVTREQLVTILHRYAQNFCAATGSQTALQGFADADKTSSYARDAMCWAVENGLVNGVTATQLSPKSTATRAQVATILMRFVRLLAGKSDKN